MDENKKEDKHVEAFIEIFKDPASMPAPPPVGNHTQFRCAKLSFAHVLGKNEKNINNFFLIRSDCCA